MLDAETGDIRLPLSGLNPMGKDHLPRILDDLLAQEADEAAAQAVAQAASELGDEPGAFKVCLVVSDDLVGGWTNRYTTELGHRFEERPYHRRGWIVGLLWTSEANTLEQVADEVRQCIFRTAYIGSHGYARTLGDMLRQEAWVLARTGPPAPALDCEDLDYTREVLAPLLDRSDRPTLIAALFGDPAAHQLGYPPLGLSPRAGLALAGGLER